MEFYQYQSNISLYRKTLNVKVSDEEVYEALAKVSESTRNPFGFRHAELDKNWTEADKPYYNIYPAIVPMIERLTLDIPCDAITLPDHVINIRLPKPPYNPFVSDDIIIRSIIFGRQPVAKEKGSKELVDGICLGVDIGEITVDNKPRILSPTEQMPYGAFPVYTFKNFPLLPERTIDQVAESLPYHTSWLKGLETPKSLILKAIKLVCCVCLIGDDPDIITPDILAKDRDKFDKATDEQKEAIISRAKRRGKNGYNIGADIDKIPHYRRSHLAIVWTGKGRVKAKIIMRKGSIVHREIITKIPTGYDK